MERDSLTRDENHVYRKDGHILTSVTTWVKSHWPDFNPDKPLFYHKTLEKHFTIAQWTAHCVREEIRGNGPVAAKSSQKKNPEKEDPYYYTKRLFKGDWKKEVEQRKEKTIPVNANTVKRLWDEKGRESAEEGSRIHDLIEQAILEDWVLEQYMEERQVVAAMTYLRRLKNLHGKEAEILPEFMVGSVALGLAGTVDIVVKKGNDCVLVDWKTNDTLSWDGHEKGLTESTKNLENSNLQTYFLQLSLYKYLLEKEKGWNIKSMYIYHLDSLGDYKEIEVDYQGELLESMLREDGKI